MKAPVETLKNLEERLHCAADTLAAVDGKKMFGCEALFAKGNVFALVWKEGRIGVKLPDAEDYASLLSLKGAAPWKAGPMTMAHWILVPASVQDDPRSLRRWVKRAHELALSAPPKAAKPARKKAGAKKKPAKKKS